MERITISRAAALRRAAGAADPGCAALVASLAAG